MHHDNISTAAGSNDRIFDEKGFDESGKVSLDHIYTQPDPRAYFTTLRRLDYVIPELAKPFFGQLVDEHGDRRGRAPVILDVGCSYGVNAALLRCDLTMADMYARYAGLPAGGETGPASLAARDRALTGAHRGPTTPRFIGLDSSRPAIAYALAAGFLDDAVCADLENREPTSQEQALLAEVDLVVSTGCIGYIGAPTIERIARAADEHRRPAMAHFVLRMFPFDPIADALGALGYETERVDGVFPQRRFASAREREQVLDTLATVGVDPRGLEADGWLYAELHISRPRGTASLAAGSTSTATPTGASRAQTHGTRGGTTLTA
ncbi:class I SAM-dependent methyltransferase [Frankia sp. AgPm24]|uniref:class I SAM-dependent methyltransferase n=1 Tax=Frankia sp. AgPm24 TaxID=631128 RepID=UPI00200FDA7B|nr:class I SAM-dependent methyltransferase [Frankia sp. AgPm24]MCK9921796.1 class I SAM-dependent methyltransferase [Frankia sp. AgPm24]